ncbi:MAG: GtrA family protein [Hyphomonadaceae bacterium]
MDAGAEPNRGSLWGKARREGRMLALFALVGAGGFVVDALVLKVGLALGASNALARLISLAAGMHFTFTVNRVTAFRHLRSAPLARQWLLYLAANSLGALVNYGVFLALTADWLARAPVIAAGCGAIAGLAVNFAGSRLLAFRR